MKRILPPFPPFFTAITLVLGLLWTVTTVQAQGCLSAAETRAVIASGQVVRLAAIRSAASANGYPQIASASLCGSSGSYIYSVVATSNSGASARLTFDARSGSLLGVN